MDLNVMDAADLQRIATCVMPDVPARHLGPGCLSGALRCGAQALAGRHVRPLLVSGCATAGLAQADAAACKSSTAIPARPAPL